MRDWKRMAGTVMAGLMLAGIATGPIFGYPDDKPKDKPKTDVSSVLEKLPPDVREKIKAEMDRIRSESEKLRAQVIDIQQDARLHAERVQKETMARVEEIQQGAKRNEERMQNEMRRQLESREREQNQDRAREREKNQDRERQAQRSPARPDAEARQEVRREVRVEVRKEGDSEPKVQIFENGKPVAPDQMRGRVGMNLNFQAKPPELDLSKLPPEKRQVIEKARKEFKEAEVKFRESAERLAKAEGRDQPGGFPVMPGMANGQIFVMPNAGPNGQPNMQLRAFPGGRLPGMPLPPGAGRGDRLPRQPMVAPELEKRVSKAEKALDDILNELKRIREDEESEEEESEEDLKQKGKGKKKKV